MADTSTKARKDEEERFNKYIHYLCDPELSPHYVSLVKLAKEVGYKVQYHDNSFAMRPYILIICEEHSLLLDGIDIQFTYEAYRLINAALQGLGWFNQLTEKKL